METTKPYKPFEGWTILADADGTLTDGKKVIDCYGERDFINFHARDSTACRLLIQMGFQVIVLTHSKFNGIAEYWHKYLANIFCPEDRDIMTNKLRVEDAYTIDWDKTIAIGDDITDACFLNKAKFSYIVSDAHPHYKGAEGLNYQKLPCKGGEGVLAHIYQIIQQGKHAQ